MTIKKVKQTDTTKLRLRAEERLGGNTEEVSPCETEKDPLRLLHELQVHRIELEMQNEELRQARNGMAELLEKYSDLYDFAPVAYYTLDRNGIIRAVNLTGAGLLGIERSRLNGKCFERFIPLDSRSAFSAFLAMVFASPAKESCELPLLKEGNSSLFVQIEAVAALSGEECRIAVIDISERKRMEELRQSEARYRSVVEDQTEIICRTKGDGTLTFVNDVYCRVFEKTRDEVIEGRWHPDVFPEDLPMVKEKLGTLSPSNKIVVIENRVHTGSGKVLWMQFVNRGVFDTEGRLLEIQAVGRDITERKEIEAELKRLNTDLAARTAELESSNRELAAFNYMVSHDLCQPLNNIHTSAQAVELMCMGKLDEECKMLLQIIKKAAMNMRNLIGTFLRFSQSEHVELHGKMVDLSEMARVIAADLRLSDSGRRVTFNIMEGVKVYGDPELLRVVLENIIGNAWKYTGNREQATIEFGTMEMDGRKTYFIRDNGPGFDIRDAEKLFVPFKRLQGSEELTGHGVGLATVERIIRRHGGKVWAWAQGEPCRGATIFFTLGE